MREDSGLMYKCIILENNVLSEISLFQIVAQWFKFKSWNTYNHCLGHTAGMSQTKSIADGLLEEALRNKVLSVPNKQTRANGVLHFHILPSSFQLCLCNFGSPNHLPAQFPHTVTCADNKIYMRKCTSLKKPLFWLYRNCAHTHTICSYKVVHIKLMLALYIGPSVPYKNTLLSQML